MKTLGEFRKLTAKLPDNTRLLTDAFDHRYREIGCCITTAIANIRPDFDPDFGDEPELYGLETVEQVQKARRTVVVIE